MANHIAQLFSLLSTLVLSLFIASTCASLKTKDPFYPCQSATSANKMFTVCCSNISGKRVKTAFERNKIYHIDQFIFHLEKNKDKNIPANVIGNHSIGKIAIYCPGKNSPLRVDSEAFSLTKSVTDTLNISNCNLQYLNWSFLKGFSNLSSLYIVANSSNLHQRFYTLPTRTLLKLEVFSLDSVLGLNGFNRTCLKFPAPPPKGLTDFTIENCYDMGTAALQNLLTKWVTPTSVETLIYLSLSNNSLTSIPAEVSKYQLGGLKISGNLQPLTIQSRALNVIGTYPYFRFFEPIIILSDSKITSISPGGIQGMFGGGYFVDLSGNQLATLDFNVFSFYTQYPFGTLFVAGNPIDCSVKNQCNLAWLFSYDGELGAKRLDATCSNGTLISGLLANNLRYTNGTQCPIPEYP